MSELQPRLERVAELHRVDPGRPLALLELVRYAAPARPRDYVGALAALGGRLRFRGRVEQQFVGSAEADWDEFLIFEFRSRVGFAERLADAPDLGSLLAQRRSYAAHPGPGALPRLARVAGRLLRLVRPGPGPLPASRARAQLGALGCRAGRGLGPSPAQLEAFLAGDPWAPVVMFHLLAYRSRAHYDPALADGDVSGREAYRRYARGIARLLLGVGARPLWLGRAETTLVGAPEAWDEFAVVAYPSRAAFLGMLASPAYRAQLHHRHAGLARTELVQCAPCTDPAGGQRL